MDQVLKTRTISGVIFGVVVLGMLGIGQIGLLSLLMIVLFGGIFEYTKITKVSVFKKIASFVLATAVALAFFIVDFSANQKYYLLTSALFAYIFLSVSIFKKGLINHQNLLPIFVLIYPCLSLLLPIPFLESTFNTPLFWISIIILIWSSDSFAYLIGRKIGKNKLFESISPKKTWEGFLGAGICTSLFACLIGNFFSNLPLSFWMLAGLVIWIAGTFGDLFESTIKRAYDVKDSGNILPGHGGFLDRFDSFIFVIPFVLYLLYIYNLIS